MCDHHRYRMRKYGNPHYSSPNLLVGASLAERLEAYTDRSGGPDACWPWTRGKSDDGYGRVYVPSNERPPGGPSQINASRAAWIVANGHPIPARVEVLHSCDNPPCCNPAHLALGTHADNMGEMSRRKRASSGERNPRTKLSDIDVVEARRMRAAGQRTGDIAAHFKVSQPYVSRLTRGLRR